MKTVTAQQLKNAFIVGAARLEENKDIINELNVFPVPDGDTGTNMSMTVSSAVGELKALDSEEPKVICKAISQGALRGARGNSGVILSQLFRGFYKVIKTAETVDTCVFADALTKATETAYRAVMKPKEGTILTVAKGISERAAQICTKTEDFVEFYDELVKHAEMVLEKTPEMLPVLKQAGVVDSGGTGLLEILRGAADYIAGRADVEKLLEASTTQEEDDNQLRYKLSLKFVEEGPRDQKLASDLKVYLESIGTIEVFEPSGNMIEISINTNEPGRAITRMLKSGTVTSVELNNTKPPFIQKAESGKGNPTPDDIEQKEIGFVTVSAGDGLSEIFEGLGVDHVIHGGQTMNPSTEDILDAVAKVSAKCVFVMPNNKNIRLAAEQAAKLCKDKEVVVIPTTTIPQGITAMINYLPEKTPEENKEIMTEEIGCVKSGEITYAVRDTMIDNFEIKKGDFMGICDSGIGAVEKSIDECVISLVAAMKDEDSSLLSLYFGEETKEKDAEKLVKKLAKEFPDLEVELQRGGQPVYYYFLSIE